ncbi:iron chaperone [Chloroflexus sp.]|uniref:iron chaperone n=1 Tax=Chloroflexus sp. TaxID=1904827 RepID=UPI002601E3D1|nr:DUF1801 domain-containing protein [uncultured Chloroflexus sp.]
MKREKQSTEDDDQSGFSAAERAAMRERAKELKEASRRRGKGSGADDVNAVLEKIAEMPEPDRTLATRLHEIIMTNAPMLAPRLWYGMPAYALMGKVICFFQSAQKFQTRYATLGFSDSARLDDGAMWPTAFAVTGLTPEVEEHIAALVRRAVASEQS